MINWSTSSKSGSLTEDRDASTSWSAPTNNSENLGAGRHQSARWSVKTNESINVADASQQPTDWSIAANKSRNLSEMQQSTSEKNMEVNLTGGIRQSTSWTSSSIQSRNASFNQQCSLSPERIEYDENESKIYLSVLSHGNRFGAAYYNIDARILYMMPDITETDDLKMLQQLLVHVTPDVVLTSSKQKDKVLQFLKKLAYDICKRRICGVNGLPGLSDDATDEERAIYFSSYVSIDNSSMVSATGALLKYLDQSRPGMELEDAGIQVPIIFIKLFYLSDLMMIDGCTYSSLQIFQKESHPSVYKSGGTGKEGLSLFGIMNHTKSTQGSALLRNWFLQPTTNKTVLTQRLEAINYFISPRNIEMMVALQDALKNMKNVTRILSKMKSTGASSVEWNNLYKTIFNAICIGDICRGLPQDIYIVSKISDTFSKDLLHMADLIKKIVDFEESSYANHFVVREGIDEELDEKKRTFDGIPSLMTKIAQEELTKLNDSITVCGVTYFPQLGYLLNIPLTERMKETGNYDADDSLEFRFVAEDLVYYKSEATTELDQKLGDIQCDIRDHETNIMYRLQEIILERVECMLQVIELSAELDCILSLTCSARELGFTQPKLLDMSDDVINITGGRHPLQELCVNQFVKNDSMLGGENGKVNIITGPNASGKSVYIKQVGVIVYLCHIGSYVPCDSCEMSIKDGLFTRIRTTETVSLPLSTFMIDLNQVSNATTNATKNSFIIIDEFGKGTSAVDGLALLCATLQYWIDKDDFCPNVLVSTHFHQIRNLLNETDIVAYKTMEVMRTDNDGELVFLYQIKDGFAEQSYASHTAKIASIPQHVITRAEQVSQNIRNHEKIEKLSSEIQQDQKERYHQIVEEFLQKDIETDDMVTFLQCIIEN